MPRDITGFASVENTEEMEQFMLDILPRAGLPMDSSKEERIAKIFGIKISQLGQLLKQIKDSLPSVFKDVMKEVKKLGLRRDIPKDALEIIAVSYIFSSVDYRRKLLIEHFRLEHTKSSQKARPPILEYELIKAWNPELDLTRTNSVSKNVFEGDIGLKVTHTAQFFVHLHPTINRRFGIIADKILLDLTCWNNKTNEEKSLLAGAVFAIASASDSASLLLVLSNLAPDLTDYIYTDDFISSSVTNGSIAASESETNPMYDSSRQILLGTIKAVYHLDAFGDTGKLEHLNKARNELDFCEKESLSLGAFAKDEIKKTLTEISQELAPIKEFFSSAGVTIDVSSIEGRVGHWQSLLLLKIMESPSHARKNLIDNIASEVLSVHSLVCAQRKNLESIAAKHEETLIKKHDTWAEQLKLLQETVKETEEAQQNFSNLCNDVRKLKPIQVPQTEEKEEVLEVCSKSETKALLDAHKLELEHIKLQLEQTVERNNELRREVAEARKQAEIMVLSLGEQKEASAGVTKEVMGAIDALASKATPVELLKLLKALYPDRVDILDSAYISAKEDQASIPETSLYQRMTALLTEGLDIVRETGQIIDCKDVVPGEVAVQESDTVRNSAKLRSMRHFTYKGSKRAFYSHFRLNSVCRVYFDYIPEERRIVVAYVGRHLPT